jgi:uncharacterized metal-binding protein YceD (DUF177 family)
MTETPLRLSRIVRRADVPEDGLDITIEADGEALTALVGFLDIPAVETFRAEMTVERWRRDGLAVRGRVEAEVVQTCVVTLAPVRNAVAESFEDFYAPDPDALRAQGVVAPAPEDVEPLVDQRVDVGGLAVEHLVLGLDPYPRCEGAEVEAADEAGEGAESGPFAALAALRKGGDRR